MYVINRISIHAPPRGATMSDQELHDFLIISIHAPPRGATLCRRMLRIFSAFQFTPLREGRHYTVLDRSALTIFQFTPLREGRRLPTRRGIAQRYFNSRLSNNSLYSTISELVAYQISSRLAIISQNSSMITNMFIILLLNQYGLQ